MHLSRVSLIYLKKCLPNVQSLRQLSTKDESCVVKPLKVGICGASTPIGQFLSLCLTLSKRPVFKQISLFDASENCCTLGVELAYLSAESQIKSFNGTKFMGAALEGCDIVALCLKPTNDVNECLKTCAKSVKEAVESCAKVCPDATLAVCNGPISSLVPIACEEMKKHGRFNPKKVLGVTNLGVLRSNTLLASLLKKGASESVFVPVIGGATARTMVPLFSIGSCDPLTPEDLDKLSGALKASDDEVKGADGTQVLSEAYAAFRFIQSLGQAMKGAKNLQECCFISSDKYLGLGYSTNLVQLGQDGVEILMCPEISEQEKVALENAKCTLKEEIDRGVALARNGPVKEVLET